MIFRQTKKLIVFAAAIILFAVFGAARADFNPQINYQGKLTDSANVPVGDGSYDIVFKIYTAAGGGDAAWTESWTDASLFTDTNIDFTEDGCDAVNHIDKIDYTDSVTELSLAPGQYLWNITKQESTVVESVNTAGDYICVYGPASGAWDDGDDVTNRIYVKSGLFSVMLGSLSSLGSFDFDRELWLGVQVGADDEMIPRKKFGAVPVAYEARELLGKTWAAPGAIGSGVRNTGAFTTLDSAYAGASSALTVTQTGAGNIANLVGDAITTGTGMAVSADGLVTGTAVDISSASADGGESGISKILNLARSGANANASHTAYGLYSSVSDAGTTSTNIAGYFSASGASNNYGLIVEEGNAGFGVTAPTAVLHLKAGTTSASTAPLKFTSGDLLTAPEAGAVEFLNDAYYGTITTDEARKQFAFTDSNITGNAATATKLAATKNINGVAFDGSADITVTADANTLTGTTLHSTIVSSSLTSVGTLGNLTVTNPISGSVTGNAGTVTNGVYTNAANSFSLINPLTTLAESWIGPSNVNGVYFKGGNVGIGTTAPAEKLSLAGGNFLQTAGNPTLEANLALNYPIDVYVFGNYAYTIGADGLQIIDVTNSASPSLVSTFTTYSAKDVYVSGKYAYIADSGYGLQIVDVSIPNNPTLIGTYDTPGYAMGVYVSGKYAYVADDEAGLQIVDVSNPAAPTLAGTYDTTDEALGVYVSGKYAYVADWGGLQIVDVSNPAAPTLAGTYDTAGSAMGVYISGKYAYVADYDSGVQIINVSNPASPTLAGTYNTAGYANGVYVSGKYAYVADRGSGLQVVNIADPANTSLAGTYNTAGSAYSVYVSGKYAYVADDNAGLQIIDISGIDTPALRAGNIQVGSINISENADITNDLSVGGGLLVSGRALFQNEFNVVGKASFASNVGIGTAAPAEKLVLAGGNFLQTAGNPTLEATYDTSGTASGVYVSGKYAYIADYGAGLQVVDISNPASPTLAGTYNTSGSAYDVYVSGKYAYVADGSSGLQVIDVSNPAAPTLAGTYNTSGSAYDVYVSGKYAYVADDTAGLQVIDVSNPAAPTLAGTYNTSGWAKGVYVSGKYAYVGDDTSGLQVIDVSNPAVPVLAATYNTTGSANGVYISGKYAYVADGDSGVEIINISDPIHPALAGTYDAPSWVNGVYVAGKYVYISVYFTGLQIIDATDPANLSLVGSYATAGYADDVYISGKYAYVAGDTYGLHIIDISGVETPALTTGNIQVGSINITENANVANDLSVAGGLSVNGRTSFQNEFAVVGNALSSGSLVNIASASTAAASNTQTLLNLALSGTNGTSAQTTYGLKVANTHDGTTSTNVAGYFSATGGTTANYGLLVANGNVGIGTTSPGTKLDVSESNGSNNIATFTNTGNTRTAYINQWGDIYTDPAGGLYTNTIKTHDAADNLSITSRGSGDIILQDGATGKVGIGTAEPDVTLDVNGSARVFSESGGAYMELFGTGDTYNFSALKLSSNEETDKYWQFEHRSYSGEVNNLSIEEFDGSNYNQRFVIKAGGNVGIGTTSPGALLDIGSAGSTLGTLRLEGNNSGYVQIQPAGDAGSWTMTLPVNDGDNGQVLTTNGSGVTSWVAGSSALSGLTAATGTNTIDNLNFAQTWNWSTAATENPLTMNFNGLTSGVGLTLASSAAGLTTNGALQSITLSGNNVNNIGDLLYINSSGANSIAKALDVAVASTGAPTNGLVRFNFSGAHTNNGFQIDDVTTAGTAMALNANSATTGNALAISATAAGLTGNALSVTTASTGQPTNGLVRFNFNGARTAAGNGFQIDDISTTLATTMALNANSVTTGNALAISATAAGLTGNALSVTTGSTGAVTNGLVRFNFNAAHTGNGFQLDDLTATGIAMALNANSVTTGNALSIAGNALTTGSLVNIASTSTAAGSNTQTLLNLALSGTNGTSAQTTYGLKVANTHIGTTSTNVGGYFSATGGTTANYGLLVASGNVGIGTTAPGNLLSLASYAAGSDDTIPALGVNGGKFGIFRNMQYGMMMGQIVNGDAFIQVQRIDGTPTAFNLLLQPNGGSVGIGTIAPGKKLDVLEAASNAQLRISQSSVVYAEMYEDSSGDLRISATGGDIRALDENLWVCAGGACPGITPSGNGNLVVEGAVTIGTTAAGCTDATNRGTIKVTQGGNGAADLVYMCLKTSADAYNWVLIARGN